MMDVMNSVRWFKFDSNEKGHFLVGKMSKSEILMDNLAVVIDLSTAIH
jgi:hypothetical protein